MGGGEKTIISHPNLLQQLDPHEMTERAELTGTNETNTGTFYLESSGSVDQNLSDPGLRLHCEGSVGTAKIATQDYVANDRNLIFTPADFRNNTPQRGTQIASSQGDPGAPNSRWYGTCNGDGIIVAQKVIPRGFQIVRNRSTITIYTPALGPLASTCYVSAQALDIPGTQNLINLLSNTSFPVNSAELLNGDSVSGGVPGSGDRFNIVTIYWDAGAPLTTSNSPSGAIITLFPI